MELIDNTSDYLTGEIASLLSDIRELMPNASEEDILRLAFGDFESPWRGDEPLSLEDFSQSIDGSSLFPAQMNMAAKAGIATAWDVISPFRDVREIILLWGKGTLSGDTPIRDEATGRTKTIKEWHATREQISVKCVVGNRITTMETSPVYSKGLASTYRVILDDGRSVGVSPNHRFKTPHGWVKVKDLIVGQSVVFAAPMRAGRCVHGDQLIPGSQGDCRPSVRLYDGRSHAAAVACPGGVPLRHDARHGHQVRHGLGSGIVYNGSVASGSSLSQVARNCDIAYQPLIRRSDDVEFPLESPTSQTLQRALDLFCSLPTLLKRSLLNECAGLSSTSCQDRKFRSASFVSRLSSAIRQASVQSLLPSLQPQTVVESPQCQGVASDYSRKVVGVVHQSNTAEEIFDLTVPIAHNFFDANGILHHNSGKDWLSARIIAYIAYVYLNLVDPWKWLSMCTGSLDNPIPSMTRMDMVNVAPNKDLARRVYFEYLTQCIRSKPFAPFLTKPKDQILTESIHFPQINLNLWSLNSRTSAIDGYNLLCWVMDEADAFLDAADKSNAEIVHSILRTSATTRWKQMWTGFVITYTRVAEGFAERQHERALKEKSMYTERRATWEVRTNISQDDEDIQAEYRDDPDRAAAMFECLPQATVSGFFEFPEMIENSIGEDRVPIAYVTAEEETIRTMASGREAHYISARLEKIGKPDPGRLYYLSGDAGVTGDMFALSVMSTVKPRGEGVEWVCQNCAKADGMLNSSYSLDGDVPDEAICGGCYTFASGHRGFGQKLKWWRVERSEEPGMLISRGIHSVTLPYVREELVFAVKPRKAQRGSPAKLVDFLAMEDVCARIIDELGVSRAVFDDYQTVQMVQGLQARTSADVCKISYQMQDQVRRARLSKILLHNALLDLIGQGFGDLIKTRNWEWRRLQKKILAATISINHPENGSKDMFDAESGCIWAAVEGFLGGMDLGWLLETQPTTPTANSAR